MYDWMLAQLARGRAPFVAVIPGGLYALGIPCNQDHAAYDPDPRRRACFAIGSLVALHAYSPNLR